MSMGDLPLQLCLRHNESSPWENLPRNGVAEEQAEPLLLQHCRG